MLIAHIAKTCEAIMIASFRIAIVARGHSKAFMGKPLSLRSS
jgi:hypothetical protein